MTEHGVLAEIAFVEQLAAWADFRRECKSLSLHWREWTERPEPFLARLVGDVSRHADETGCLFCHVGLVLAPDNPLGCTEEQRAALAPLEPLHETLRREAVSAASAAAVVVLSMPRAPVRAMHALGTERSGHPGAQAFYNPASARHRAVVEALGARLSVGAEGRFPAEVLIAAGADGGVGLILPRAAGAWVAVDDGPDTRAPGSVAEALLEAARRTAEGMDTERARGLRDDHGVRLEWVADAQLSGPYSPR